MEKRDKDGIIDFASMDIDEVYKTLNTTIDGLSENEVSKRIEKYGLNVLEKKKSIGFFTLFINQFKSLLVGILVIAVIISIFLGEIIDSIAIIVILLINSLLGALQEFKAEKSLEALKKYLSEKAIVIRKGERKEIDAKYLVPGDMIVLEEGMKVPADIRLVKATNLKVMEAILTGESIPVEKDNKPVSTSILGEKKCMVFSGTEIMTGRAIGIVTATGKHTELGKIAESVQSIKREETPLQKKLEVLAKKLGIMTIGLAFVIFLIYSFVDKVAIIDGLMVAISLAVAAIPEGLPAVVTISLSLGAKRMVSRNALMRRLASVETLGSTTVICTDKTGTLTKNELTVKKIFDGKEIDVYGTGYAPLGGFSHPPPKLLLKAGAICNNSSLKEKDGHYVVLGDPTEGALITAAMKASIEIHPEIERLGEISFNSERKMMSVLCKENGKLFIYSKGAPEVLIEKCSKVLIDGTERELDLNLKKLYLQKAEEYAKHAMRVIAIAYKETNKRVLEEGDEQGFILLGLEAMIDPPRPEVREAIEKCKTAGIRVIMITGDHIETARAIGEEVGIKGKAILGKDIDKVDIGDISIFARVNPSDKLKIVDYFRDKGEVVAMTGDGVNDAPAIKKADIGISVGSGTDVAKDASEMVLLDDNFATIVNAIEEGRGIFNNIRKFVNYLLSANLGEVLAVAIAGFLSVIFPDKFGAVLFTALNLLWINLLTDGLPALALGIDPTSPKVMKQSPRDPKEPVINTKMLISIISTGIIIALTALMSFSYFMPDVYTARSVALTSIILLESTRIFVIKKGYEESIFNNKWLIFSIIFSILLQLIAMYTPFSTLLKIAPLNGVEWLFTIIISIIASILIYILDVATKRLFSKT